MDVSRSSEGPAVAGPERRRGPRCDRATEARDIDSPPRVIAQKETPKWTHRRATRASSSSPRSSLRTLHRSLAAAGDLALARKLRAARTQTGLRTAPRDTFRPDDLRSPSTALDGVSEVGNRRIIDAFFARSSALTTGPGSPLSTRRLPKHVRYQATLLPACLSVNIARYSTSCRS